MRLWSIDPSYLDSIWLVALWREWLLAKKVLEWKTKWYKNHPQLERFKYSTDSLVFINNYLYCIFLEAKNRWYKFDVSKIEYQENFKWKIEISLGQINFEFEHLQNKLYLRSFNKFKENSIIKTIKTNCIFKINKTKKTTDNWEKSMI